MSDFVEYAGIVFRLKDVALVEKVQTGGAKVSLKGKDLWFFLSKNDTEALLKEWKKVAELEYSSTSNKQ